MDSRRGRIYLAAKKRAEGVEETGLGFGRIVLGKFLGRGWRGGDRGGGESKVVRPRYRVAVEEAPLHIRTAACPRAGCGITGSATDAGTRFWRNFSRTNLVLVLVFFILLVFV
jgi:hypothetical protein